MEFSTDRVKSGALVVVVLALAIAGLGYTWHLAVSAHGGSAASDATNAATASNGKIVFFRGFGSGASIYLVDPNTAPLEPETPLGPGQSPVWKPDGSTILFVDPTSNENGNQNSGEIKLMDASGSNVRALPTRVYSTSFYKNVAVWSPDSTKIAFTRLCCSGSFSTRIWMMNADGTGQTQLSTGQTDQDPAWAPDGTKVSFTRGSANGDQIFTVTTTGSESQLTNVVNRNSRRAHWSPDGTRLAFESDRDGSFGGRPDIYVMNAQGVQTQRLTNDSFDDHNPSYSPDGLKIAWESGSRPEANNNTIFVMPSSGNPVAASSQIKTTSGFTTDNAPSWGPGVAASPTPTPTPISATLSFDGRLRDRVSKSDAGIFPDGESDGTFSLTLPPAAFSKSFQSIVIAGPNGNVWDTIPQTTNIRWIVGVADMLDRPLLNQADGSINAPVGSPGTFKLFVPDSNPSSFVSGASFTVTVKFSDNSTVTASTIIAQNPRVDLGLTIKGPTTPVRTTDTILYQLRVTNYGTQTATGVRVVTFLAPNLVYDHSKYGNCTVIGNSSTGQTVTCGIVDNDIWSGYYANILLYVRPLQGGNLTTTATARANEIEPSPDPHSNTANISSTVNTAVDLSVTIDAPSSIANGAEISYRIKVKNNTTNADAHGVTLTDTLPAGVTNVSMTGPATSTVRCDVISNGQSVCHLDTVERGFSYEFILKLIPPGNGNITNKANVASDVNPDPNTLNNDATQVTVAKTVSNIVVTMDAPTQVPQGENITYLTTVRNIGTVTAQDVTFADAWSDNSVLVSFSPAPGSQTPNCFQVRNGQNSLTNYINCNLGSIAAGQQLTVRVTVRPVESGDITNQAFAFPYSANYDAEDSDPTNNVAARSTVACVQGAGSAPTFQTTAGGVAGVDQSYKYRANATDRRGARIRYSLTQAPTGMTIDVNSGQIEWTPTAGSVNSTVQVAITASNGTCNGTATQSFSLAVGDTSSGGFLLQQGMVEIKSSSSVRVGGAAKSVKVRAGAKPQLLIEDGTYKLGGNTKINDFLSVDGDITIVVDKVHDRMDFDINGGKGYLTNIPLIHTKVLWEGGRTKFTLNGQGVLSGINQTGNFIQKLEEAKIGIGITNAQLLFAERGMRIQGNVTLPAVPGIPGLTAMLQGLEISRQNGVRFQGQISLPDFSLGGFSIRGVKLDFQPDPGGNTDKDIFIGQGSLVVPNTVTVIGRIKFVGGSIDSVLATVNLANGLPLVPPLLTLLGGTVSVEGLRTGQFSIFIAGDFTITDARLANVVKFTNAGVRYTAPGNLSGSSDLELMTFNVAQAGLGILNLPSKKEFSFDANVTLIDSLPVLLVGANVKTGAQVTDSGASFFFQGTAYGRLQIPNGQGFGYDLVRTFVGPLPRQVAGLNVAVGFPPAQFSTAVTLPVVGDFHVAVRNIQVAAQNQIQVLVGRNLNALQQAASARTPPEFTTAAYQKKMLRAVERDPETTKDPLAAHSLYVPIINVAESQPLGTVTVPANQPKAFFRLLGGQTAPRFDLIAPNGSRITPDNAPANNAAFAQDIDSNQSFYVVTNPLSGIWSVEAADGADGPFVLDSLSANKPPVLTNAQATPQSNGSVQITYNATDVDNADANVSLYYSNDASSYNGTLIKENLTPAVNGLFTWNAGNGSVPSGDYYVYAVIDDGLNLPVKRYAPTQVHVVDSLAPAAPQNVTVIPGAANNLVLSWSPNSEADLRGYQVLYDVDRGDNAPLSQTIDAGNSTTIRLMNLANFTRYRIAVVAYSGRDIPDANNPGQTVIESRAGAISQIVSATSGIGMPPLIQVTSPNGGETLVADQDATISWQLDRNSNDVLTQLVEVSTDGTTFAPLQVNIDGNVRNVRWHIPGELQTNNARVRVTSTDTSGNQGVDVSDADFIIAPASITPLPTLTVGGRVLTPSGLGLRNAVVTLIDDLGVRRTATTSSFGVYSFSGIGSGRTYTLTVASKRYRFAARVTQFVDSVSNFDFIGLE